MTYRLSSQTGAPWWQGSVIYQIYPRSFADGNGDGVGDLAGLAEHLDYVAALGVDAVWLNPVYRSPMADFGYDITDHVDIDPAYETLTDLDRLIDAAHRRGVRIILDLVPNHSTPAAAAEGVRLARICCRSSQRRGYVDGGPPRGNVDGRIGGAGPPVNDAAGGTCEGATTRLRSHRGRWA
jgi:alpha-glucosidase